MLKISNEYDLNWDVNFSRGRSVPKKDDGSLDMNSEYFYGYQPHLNGNKGFETSINRQAYNIIIKKRKELRDERGSDSYIPLSWITEEERKVFNNELPIFDLNFKIDYGYIHNGKNFRVIRDYSFPDSLSEVLYYTLTANKLAGYGEILDGDELHLVDITNDEWIMKFLVRIMHIDRPHNFLSERYNETIRAILDERNEVVKSERIRDLIFDISNNGDMRYFYMNMFAKIIASNISNINSLPSGLVEKLEAIITRITAAKYAKDTGDKSFLRKIMLSSAVKVVGEDLFVDHDYQYIGSAYWFYDNYEKIMAEGITFKMFDRYINFDIERLMYLKTLKISAKFKYDIIIDDTGTIIHKDFLSVNGLKVAGTGFYKTPHTAMLRHSLTKVSYNMSNYNPYPDHMHTHVEAYN